MVHWYLNANQSAHLTDFKEFNLIYSYCNTQNSPVASVNYYASVMRIYNNYSETRNLIGQ
jgi:hypothetical protein